jgi:hypothetical protein
MAGTTDRLADPTRQLVVEWATCGIAAAASRFIPVPLVDDVVKDRATWYAVHRTLRAHERTFDEDAVEVLWSGTDNLGRSMARALGSVPRRILLFPVRKYVAIFGSVRGVPNDVLRVVLLGRTVHRALGQGRLANGTDEKALGAEALRIRRAYDEAVQYQDFRLLRGALTDGLSQGRGLTRQAVRFARDAFARDREPDLEPGGQVEETAREVAAVLRRPDVVEELAGFDRRVDEQLGRPPA